MKCEYCDHYIDGAYTLRLCKKCAKELLERIRDHCPKA